MKIHLFEWIITPIALIVMTVRQAFAYWHEEKTFAIVFLIQSFLAVCLLVYGMYRLIIACFRVN